MRIHVDATSTPAQTVLVDPDDFDAFELLLEGDEDPAAEAVSALGELADVDHVYVEPDRLIALAGDRGRNPVWIASLREMIAYADTRGWVDSEGRVRAHIVRPGG
jgi:hypothetical protein